MKPEIQLVPRDANAKMWLAGFEQGKLELEKETEKHYANVVYPKTGDDDEFYRTGWEDCIDFLRLKSQLSEKGGERK